MISKNKFKGLTGILKLVMLAPTNTKTERRDEHDKLINR
jgi:hypothetical protein